MTIRSHAASLALVVPLGLLAAGAAVAQTGPAAPVDGGVPQSRWITRGTFAVSDAQPNEMRERTYAGAHSERQRVSTFLPGMTIFFEDGRPAHLESFKAGLTHHAIPVQVVESELSRGKFNERSVKDVVIHEAHDGCRNVACTGDTFTVGIGESYQIVEQNADHVELLNDEEKRVIYAADRFAALEIDGTLTVVKDRRHPRWSIHDGYASEISTGCGDIKRQGLTFTAPAEEFEGDPATWDANAVSWSLKAIQITRDGYVVKDPDTGQYTGTLTYDIRPSESLRDRAAIDFTVFAYRDSNWTQGYYKFGGIAQVVNCSGGSISGALRPTYTLSADVYLDLSEGETEETPYYNTMSMPRVHSLVAQEQLFGKLRRSFFYSVNDADQYRTLFQRISKIVPLPIAVANIVARLNASCGSQIRASCAELSEFLPAEDVDLGS